MVLQYLMLALTALGGGAIISAAVFALIASTGVITRMAGKTHTGKYVRVYETAVILGGSLWNLFWIFSIDLPIPQGMQDAFQVLMGSAQGIFVGCLAVSLAEALNATAIFARRTKLKIGLSFIILSAAIGKVIGALIQFVHGWVKG